jgi:hypothetical protein
MNDSVAKKLQDVQDRAHKITFGKKIKKHLDSHPRLKANFGHDQRF